MHYVSIIEIGSNSMKCTICRRKNDVWCVVAKKKTQVHLARHLTVERFLKEAAVKKVIWGLQQFKKVEDAYGCRGSFVFATGALRLALNQAEIVKTIKEKMHASIHILSGNLEALLGYLALQQKEKLETGIILDTGGASTELTVVSQSSPASLRSYPFGALTLSNDYFNQKERDWRLFVEQLKEEIVLNSVHTKRTTTLVTIGGSHHFLKDIAGDQTFSNDFFKQQLYELLEKAEEEFVTLKWIPKHRIASFKGGILPLLAVLDVFHVSKIAFHRLTITEGVIAALNEKNKKARSILNGTSSVSFT